MRRIVEWIDEPEGLRRLARDVAASDVIGLDTEQDSFFAYRPKICLVQIGLRDRDVILDPLALRDLGPLAGPLGSPDVRVVLHAADNDIDLLRKQFGLEVRGLFDTMTAASVLGYPKTGLAYLLERHFGIRLDKKYQRSDWRIRPLAREQVEYAAMDVRYLPKLYERLRGELEEAGRTEEAESEFRRTERVSHPERRFDPEGWKRIRGWRDLDERGRGALAELYRWRERLAARLDRAPFRVIGNAALLALARARPKDVADLERLRGLNRRIVGRHARDILNAIERGSARPPRRRSGEGRRGPAGRRSPDRELDEAARARFEALRDWRRRRAAERAVDPGRVLPSATLRSLARARPTSRDELARLGLEPWRIREYGAEILEVLKKG